jgi:ribonuclease P protein component
LTTDISDAAGAVSNTSDHTDAAGQNSAVSFSLSAYTILKKRSQFVAAAKAEKQGSPSLMVQARRRTDDGPIGVGFTCSKKVGNAVARNRAKRRLRAAAQQIIPNYGQLGYDYVLIGRRDVTAERPFHLLCQDLQRSLHKLHSR